MKIIFTVLISFFSIAVLAQETSKKATLPKPDRVSWGQKLPHVTEGQVNAAGCVGCPDKFASGLVIKPYKRMDMAIGEELPAFDNETKDSAK